MPRQSRGSGAGASRSGPLRPKRSDTGSRLPPFIQPGNKEQSPSPELATSLPVGSKRGHFQVDHSQSRKEGHRPLTLGWMGTAWGGGVLGVRRVGQESVHLEEASVHTGSEDWRKLVLLPARVPGLVGHVF